jgi:hypothetical protein
MYVTYSAAGAASSKPLPTGAASSAPFLMGVALPAGAALLVPTQPCTMPFSVVDDANTKPPLPPSPVQMQMQFPWSMHTQLRRPATLPCHMPLKPIVKPPTPREKPPQPSHLAMPFQTATLQQRLRRWRDSSPGHAVPAGGFRPPQLACSSSLGPEHLSLVLLLLDIYFTFYIRRQNLSSTVQTETYKSREITSLVLI